METFLVILVEVVMALGSLALSDEMNKSAEARSAKETKVRSMFNAVKSRFGVTYDQLSQLGEKLDIKLNQLIDATRGSARLSRASKILRDYSAKYPAAKDKVNAVKNVISKAIGRVDEYADQAASEIQGRRGYSTSQVLKEVAPDISVINTELTDLNNEMGDDSTQQIGTELTEKIDSKEEPTRNTQGTWKDRPIRIGVR